MEGGIFDFDDASSTSSSSSSSGDDRISSNGTPNINNKNNKRVAVGGLRSDSENAEMNKKKKPKLALPSADAALKLGRCSSGDVAIVSTAELVPAAKVLPPAKKKSHGIFRPPQLVRPNVCTEDADAWSTNDAARARQKSISQAKKQRK